MTVDGIAKSRVPRRSFCSISRSPPSWLEPNTIDLRLAAELFVGATGELVGRQVEERAGAADVAELELGLRCGLQAAPTKQRGDRA